MSDVQAALKRVNACLDKNREARRLIGSNPVLRQLLADAVNRALSDSWDVANLATGDDWSGSTYCIFHPLAERMWGELIPANGMPVPNGAEWCDETGRWWPEQAKVFGPAEVAEWRTGTLKWRWRPDLNCHYVAVRGIRPHARIQYPAYVDAFVKNVLVDMAESGGCPGMPSVVKPRPVPRHVDDFGDALAAAISAIPNRPDAVIKPHPDPTFYVFGRAVPLPRDFEYVFPRANQPVPKNCQRMVPDTSSSPPAHYWTIETDSTFGSKHIQMFHRGYRWRALRADVEDQQKPTSPRYMGIVPDPGAVIPADCERVYGDYRRSTSWRNVLSMRVRPAGKDFSPAQLTAYSRGQAYYRVPYSSEPLYLDVIPEDGKPVPKGCQKRNALGAWLDFPPCSFSDRHAAQHAHGQRWRVKAATYPL